MSIRSHIAGLLGYPRRRPVTRDDVQVGSPPPEAQEALLQAQQQTAELVHKLGETQRLARSVQQSLATGALKIVQHRGN